MCGAGATRLFDAHSQRLTRPMSPNLEVIHSNTQAVRDRRSLLLAQTATPAATAHVDGPTVA